MAPSPQYDTPNDRQHPRQGGLATQPPEFSERHDSLWMLTVSPTIWAAHFLASYLTAAIWCAKYAGASRSLGTARTAIGLYTLVAIIGIALTGWLGLRRVRFHKDAMPHDDDTPLDRHRFLGLSTFLLSALSAIATLFVAAVVVFVETCD